MFTKKIQLIFIIILSHSFAMACTFPKDSFCRTFDNSPDDPTIFGKIVAIDNFGIDVEVIEILQGEESNPVIRIWSGTDFECNGTWSLAAADIGELNDSIIIILERITEFENDWDVLGDYRRQHPYTAETELKVENGIVNGFLAGHYTAPYEYNLHNLDFPTFKQRIIEDHDCSVIVNTEDLDSKIKVSLNNPFFSELHVEMNEPIRNGQFKLFSSMGQIVNSHNINNQNELIVSTSDLPSGIYFLEIRSDGRRLDLIKVVKI